MPFGTLKMVKPYKDRKVSKWMSYNLKKVQFILPRRFFTYTQYSP